MAGKSISDLKIELAKLRKKEKDKSETQRLKNEIKDTKRRLESKRHDFKNKKKDLRHRARERLGNKISGMFDNLAKEFG